MCIFRLFQAKGASSKNQMYHAYAEAAESAARNNKKTHNEKQTKLKPK